MDDSRVAHLVAFFLREHYFDDAFYAWRAAIRLVQEMDQMAAEDEDSPSLTGGE